MISFIKAALPWILLGLALAFFAVNSVKEKKNSNVAVSMAIGILVGIVLGVTGVLDYATGISIGALWGSILGKESKEK